MSRQEGPERSLKLKSPLIPILIAVLIVLQLTIPSQVWIILLSGLGSLWVLSFVWAWSLAYGLHIERRTHFGWQQVGDRLFERVTLWNASRFPALWVEVRDHSDMAAYDISTVVEVAGKSHRGWQAHGECSTRGLYTLGPVTLRTQDPFGIYTATIEHTDSTNLMVMPPVIDLPEISVAPGGRLSEGTPAEKGMERTISASTVREYVPGDSLRYVHWPTVARTGEMYVHQFEDEPSSDWWVLLDMDFAVQVGEGAHSSVEHGVVLAASLVNRGIQERRHVGLVSYGDSLAWHPPGNDTSHLWTVLRSLAAINPGEHALDEILPRLRTSMARNTSLVIVTANLSTEWLEALEKLRRSGIVPTVLILDPATFGGEGDVESFRHLLRRIGVAHAVAPTDLLDQPEAEPKELGWLVDKLKPGTRLHEKWPTRRRTAGRWIRTCGLTAAFFSILVSILGTAVEGLETGYQFYLAGWGILLSGLLARVPLSRWARLPLNAFTGVGIITVLAGKLTPILFGLLQESFAVLSQVFNTIFREGDPIDFTRLAITADEIVGVFRGLLRHLWDWGYAYLQGIPHFDPVAIQMAWGILLWAAVTWAMVHILRLRRPLIALLPSIALAAVVSVVSGGADYRLAFLLGTAVLLVAFLNYEEHERRWLDDWLPFKEAIRTRLVWVSSMLAIVLVGFSILTPKIPLQVDYGILREAATAPDPSDPNATQSAGIQNELAFIADAQLADSSYTGLPNQHLLGSGPELSSKVVMVARVESTQGDLPENIYHDGSAPIYLSSLVFDRYTGSGWASSDTEIISYPGDSMLPTRQFPSTPVSLQLQFVEDLGSLMYTLGEPVSADQDFRIAWRTQDEDAQIFDVLGAAIDSETYQAESLLPSASVSALRTAGEEYPGWIEERFLNLPDSIPQRIIDLANETTAGQINAYDRAAAIETYLRQFPYNLDVPAPPTGEDVVEFFLFELEEGYCDYYASAMVVLARAAGLPARYVSGYVGTYYDEYMDTYIITADNAHAWPEIYFPGYGWIRFEPTSSRFAEELQAETQPVLPEDFNLQISLDSPGQTPSQTGSGGRIFWMALISVFILVIVTWRVWDFRLSRMPVAQQMPRLFPAIFRFGRWMDQPTRPGTTLLDYSDSLHDRIGEVASGSPWERWLLAGQDSLNRLTEVSIHLNFNPSASLSRTAQDNFTDYKALRSRLWLVWLLDRLTRYGILRDILWNATPKNPNNTGDGLK